jgi:glycosyltransferase involved in cell wall biosynthesis
LQESKSSYTISIVTPSYNQGQFLAETIESVLGQEGDFFLDYIVVDGGSKDNSVELMKKYEILLQREEWQIKCRGIEYRWLSEKDNGQTDAIVKGFRMAKGDVLAWLNSDDTYLPGVLQQAAVAFAKKPGATVLYGKSYFTDVEGKVIGKYPTEPFDVRRLAQFNFICQPSTFFSKHALDAVGGLDRGLHYVMDYDLWIRLARQFEFTYLPQYLSNYRLHEESKTISPKAALANSKEALEAVRKYYGWSPLNRVYMYCYHVLKSKLPSALTTFKLPLVFLSLPFALVKYVGMNKGIRLEDLKMITPSNIRKLFMDWIDIYKKY